MKKFLINVGLFITFLLCYFLQANFFTWFNISGVMPNLFVILLIYIGIFMGKKYAIWYGVILGFLIDIFIGRHFGISSIMLALTGVIAAEFERNFSKDNKITIMIMIAICTAVYEIGSYILKYIFIDLNLEVLPFIGILMVEIIFNVIIGIIVYPIMQHTGYDVEEEIKGNRLLTKYF